MITELSGLVETTKNTSGSESLPVTQIGSLVATNKKLVVHNLSNCRKARS